jgi:hypothetical protein
MQVPPPPRWIERVTLIFLTAFFVTEWATWIRILVHHWHQMPQDSRLWVVIFLPLYPMPWVLLWVKRGDKTLIALFAYLVLFSAMMMKLP